MELYSYIIWRNSYFSATPYTIWWNYSFAKLYPTFAKSFMLLGKRTIQLLNVKLL